MATIDYYFSLVSPWSYLGHRRFEDLARRHDAAVGYKPVQALPLFAATGGQPLAKRAPERRAYRLQELTRWREFLGMPLNLQPRHFPVDDTLAAGLVIAAGAAGRPQGPLIFAIMRAVWAEERDIAERATLKDIAAACGVDADALLEAAETPEIRGRFESNTQEAIAKGVFGIPTYVLGDELFWGQDRLDFLERALAPQG